MEEKKAPRKDAIGEVEKDLYAKATALQGNDWNKIWKYMLENGKSLPKAVYAKYQAAVKDNEKIKSVRSRIANIRRKMK